MDDLAAAAARARALDVGALADAIEAIGFECTRCGACCRGEPDDEHTATLFPDEVRAIAGGSRGTDWRDVARPTPFGLSADGSGETFEWALQTDDCGDCIFYEPGAGPDGAEGRCGVYSDRPLICRTYPFSLDLPPADSDPHARPMGDVVDRSGPVLAHECEGLGREIDREDAEALARELKSRAIREVEELCAVRDAYQPVDPGPGDVVVHDSEGAKHPDGADYR